MTADRDRLEEEDGHHARGITITKFSKTVAVAGILMGIGLAGLSDSFVFHELLQWHHVISNIVSPVSPSGLKYDVFVDGILLAISFALIVVGTLLEIGFLSRSAGRSIPDNFMRAFLGLVLLGFGGFNTFDGTINHLVLQIHHVKDGPNPLPLDIAFLAILGLAFVAAGVWLVFRTRLSLADTPSYSQATAA